MVAQLDGRQRIISARLALISVHLLYMAGQLGRRLALQQLLGLSVCQSVAHVDPKGKYQRVKSNGYSRCEHTQACIIRMRTCLGVNGHEAGE